MMRLSDVLAPYMPSQLREVEASFLNFFNKNVVAPEALPIRQWHMTRIEESGSVVLAYLAFVILGYYALRNIPGTIDAKSSRVLQVFMVLYNLVQVGLCAYMMVAAIVVFMAKDYKFVCNGFSLQETAMASVTWVFYMSKILDFFDTIFIVLRRKWEQLSFLHVYHHSSIFMFYWLNMNVAYDGDIYYTIVLNSFIHLIMYSYYACTAVGVVVPQPLKRAVTHAQRIQFVTMVAQAAVMLFMDCPFPRNVTITYAIYIISLFALFTQFDRRTYGKKEKADKKRK